MSEKVSVIYNAYSGLLKPQWKIETLMQRLSEDFGYEVTLIDIAQHDDLEVVVIQTCLDGADLVLSCGGDGTAHRVLNGILKSKKATKMAIVPFGTVNDFASVIGMTDDIDYFLEILKKNTFRQIDVGKCNDTYFINVVAAGAFTDIGYVVPRKLKRIFGRFAYYYYGLKDSIKHLNKAYRVKMVINDEVVEKKINLFTVSNSNSIGGFRNYARPTGVDDGFLYLMYMEKLNFFEAIGIVANYLATSELKGDKIKYHYIKHFEISCEKKLVFDIDGEKGEKLPLTIDVIEKCLNLLINEEVYQPEI
jgi:diacylglycerol kinase (ATP)